MPSSVINRSLLTDFNSTVEFREAYLEEIFVRSPEREAEDISDRSSLNEVKEKVQRQVEWYFSDDNLLKDAFLMKHIARNKHGFVSLKLVASLRKIKSLTKDCKLVAESIKHSKLLELNEDSTKVRRIDAVPDVDYSGIPKTIIITQYQVNNPEVSQIHHEYSRYGEVACVTVLHPGKSVPLYVKSCKSRFPCIGKEVCILVEYRTIEMAKRAFKECKQSWRQTPVVQLLSQQEIKPSVQEATKILTEKKSRKQRVHLAELSRHKSPRNYDSGYSGASRSPSTSPPPVRRFFNSSASMDSPTKVLKAKPAARLVTVIRNPFGPDGTKGFNLKR